MIVGKIGGVDDLFTFSPVESSGFGLVTEQTGDSFPFIAGIEQNHSSLIRFGRNIFAFDLKRDPVFRIWFQIQCASDIGIILQFDRHPFRFSSIFNRNVGFVGNDPS